MGILNLTPDSFSDGGRWLSPEACRRRIEAMVAGGADLIDVGAESTRPGAEPVGASEQLDRLAAFFEVLEEIPVPVSVDTRSARVAETGVRHGIEIVNDVSAGAADPAMAPLLSAWTGPLIAMHMRGTPRDMTGRTDYARLREDVVCEWRERVGHLTGAGIDPERIWFDPGLGFAKTAEQSWALVRAAGGLGVEGEFPVVYGPSRKRFTDVADRPAIERDPATIAVVTHLCLRGVDVVRVHNPDAAIQARAVAERLMEPAEDVS